MTSLELHKTDLDKLGHNEERRNVEMIFFLSQNCFFVRI